MITPSALRRARLRLFPICLLLAFSASLAAEDVVVDFGSAILDTWVQPHYPEAARKAKQEGRVIVEFVVEVDGTVTREQVSESSSDVFNQAALEAVKQWHFKPALEEGKPAVSGMEVPVVFTLQQLRQKKPPLMPEERYLPQPMKTEPAHSLGGGLDAEYPAELDDLRLPGVVRIQFTVEADGTARQLHVIFASHPAFVESALRTLEQAKFAPAHQGPLARSATMEYPVEFGSVGAKPADIFAANHLELLTEGASIPRPFLLIQPVYPHDRLLAGEGGKVVAEFTVNTGGQTEDIVFTASAGAEWEAAMRAAIESWAFEPVRGEAAATVRVRVTHEFAPPTSGAEARLAEKLRPGGEGVTGPAGLDQRLQPLWRGFPVYPKSLLDEQPDGDAVVEFVIDRDGRARVPHAVKASADAFGWAAVTAVTQWVFARPMRGGQPVDVLVRVPVEFKAPKT